MRALLVIAMICGAATVAWSHHAAAPVFDMNAEKTVTGVVKQVDWTNPHIWIWLDVQHASAQVETWGFEGMSPNFLARRVRRLHHQIPEGTSPLLTWCDSPV